MWSRRTLFCFLSYIISTRGCLKELVLPPRSQKYQTYRWSNPTGQPAPWRDPQRSAWRSCYTHSKGSNRAQASYDRCLLALAGRGYYQQWPLSAFTHYRSKAPRFYNAAKDSQFHKLKWTQSHQRLKGSQPHVKRDIFVWRRLYGTWASGSRVFAQFPGMSQGFVDSRRLWCLRRQIECIRLFELMLPGTPWSNPCLNHQ